MQHARGNAVYLGHPVSDLALLLNECVENDKALLVDNRHAARVLLVELSVQDQEISGLPMFLASSRVQYLCEKHWPPYV